MREAVQSEAARRMQAESARDDVQADLQRRTHELMRAQTRLDTLQQDYAVLMESETRAKSELARVSGCFRCARAISEFESDLVVRQAGVRHVLRYRPLRRSCRLQLLSATCLCSSCANTRRLLPNPPRSDNDSALRATQAETEQRTDRARHLQQQLSDMTCDMERQRLEHATVLQAAQADASALRGQAEQYRRQLQETAAAHRDVSAALLQAQAVAQSTDQERAAAFEQLQARNYDLQHNIADLSEQLRQVSEQLDRTQAAATEMAARAEAEAAAHVQEAQQQLSVVTGQYADVAAA